MKTLTTHTSEIKFDLRALSVSDKAINAIELTDEELEKASGSCFSGFGGFGCCFIPVCCFDWCGCGFGGFGGGFGGFGGGFGGFGGGW